MYCMTHNEVPKINFIIPENILAMSQIFLPHSAIYYFCFVITSRNNCIVKLIPLLLTTVTRQFINLLYYYKRGSLTLTLSKILLFVMLLLHLLVITLILYEDATDSSSMPFNWSINKHLAVKVNFISNIFEDPDTNSDHNISNPHEA